MTKIRNDLSGYVCYLGILRRTRMAVTECGHKLIHGLRLVPGFHRIPFHSMFLSLRDDVVLNCSVLGSFLVDAGRGLQDVSPCSRRRLGKVYVVALLINLVRDGVLGSSDTARDGGVRVLGDLFVGGGGNLGTSPLDCIRHVVCRVPG